MNIPMLLASPEATSTPQAMPRDGSVFQATLIDFLCHGWTESRVVGDPSPKASVELETEGLNVTPTTPAPTEISADEKELEKLLPLEALPFLVDIHDWFASNKLEAARPMSERSPSDPTAASNRVTVIPRPEATSRPTSKAAQIVDWSEVPPALGSPVPAASDDGRPRRISSSGPETFAERVARGSNSRGPQITAAPRNTPPLAFEPAPPAEVAQADWSQAETRPPTPIASSPNANAERPQAQAGNPGPVAITGVAQAVFDVIPLAATPRGLSAATPEPIHRNAAAGVETSSPLKRAPTDVATPSVTREDLVREMNVAHVHLARDGAVDRVLPPRERASFDAAPPRERASSDDAAPPRERASFDAAPPRERASFDAAPPRERASFDAAPPRERASSDGEAPPRERASNDAAPPRERASWDAAPPRERGSSGEVATSAPRPEFSREVNAAHGKIERDRGVVREWLPRELDLAGEPAKPIDPERSIMEEPTREVAHPSTTFFKPAEQGPLREAVLRAVEREMTGSRDAAEVRQRDVDSTVDSMTLRHGITARTVLETGDRVEVKVRPEERGLDVAVRVDSREAAELIALVRHDLIADLEGTRLSRVAVSYDPSLGQSGDRRHEGHREDRPQRDPEATQEVVQTKATPTQTGRVRAVL